MTVVRFLASAGLFTRLTVGPTQPLSGRVSSSTGITVLGEPKPLPKLSSIGSV